MLTLTQLNQGSFLKMNIVSNIDELHRVLNQYRGKSLGFIPTMGHLHAGHLSLCERASNENDITVVSIFINPTQFNQASDFELYPRTIKEDMSLLAKQCVDVLFMPEKSELYPDDYQIQLSESVISKTLEGEFRPGHFNGMLTVVLKLFNLIQPHRAYFGEKDYQQLLLIKKMVQALFLPIDVIACETKRAEDGLALSSRNSRLSTEARKKAALFPALLSSNLSLDEIKAQLIANEFSVDYIAESWGRRLGAVTLGGVRLIDNVKHSS